VPSDLPLRDLLEPVGWTFLGLAALNIALFAALVVQREQWVMHQRVRGRIGERLAPLIERLLADGRDAAEGWPDWINIPSKIGQVAAVRVLARERRDANLADGTLVAAVCPGLVDTEASRPWFEGMSGAQSPEQAAPDPGRRSGRRPAHLRRADPVRQDHSPALRARLPGAWRR
jgi:hypothetical protein